MIKSIEIHNFQSHKDTKISFEKGLNIIKGKTHSGKSAIVRALRFCLQNKPRGDSFRSWFANPDEPVRIKICFYDGSEITREKGKDNSYTIKKNGNTSTFKALGSKVPKELHF